MQGWFDVMLPVLMLACLAGVIGALIDANRKLDRIQRQVEHLHNKLYEAGAMDGRRRE